MGFKGFSFLLFSERIGCYKLVRLGFIWDILEDFGDFREAKTKGFAALKPNISGLFFPYLYVLIQYGYVFLFYELNSFSRAKM